MHLAFSLSALPSRPFPLGLRFFCELLSHFLSDTTYGTGKCRPELVMFRYFIKCNCRVTVTNRPHCYNFGRLVRMHLQFLQ